MWGTQRTWYCPFCDVHTTVLVFPDRESVAEEQLQRFAIGHYADGCKRDPACDPVIARARARRYELGLSQAVIAGRIGTAQSAIAELESGGSKPMLSTARRYLSAVGLRILVAEGEER
jgi:DNA-binding XRE family transcriptional regulator